MDKNYKKGFTLAEVLITLGIIGVVASLTLPAIVQKQQEKATVTALKKFYSMLSQAYIQAKLEYGTVDTWYETSMTQQERSKLVAEKLIKYIKTTKICESNCSECFAVKHSYIDGRSSSWTNNNRYFTFITADGMSVLVNGYTTPEQHDEIQSVGFIYADVIVDINGYKKPNTIGKDMFSFVLTKNKVIPSGIQNQSITSTENETRISFPGDCNTTKCFDICESCTAWVIYNENMDYLHCDDLSWDGKTSCK